MEIKPSYIWDSKYFLNPLESLSFMPQNTILVTADVTSLDTNIQNEEGIESVLRYMKLHVNTLPLGALNPHAIEILLEIILKNTNLSFMDRHFLQLVGKAWEPKSPYHTLTFSWVAAKKPSGKP